MPQQTEGPTVSLHYGLNEAKDMYGVAIVIDVFRATTTIASLLTARAERVLILPYAKDIATYAEKDGYVCFSEVVPEGHDNSPLTALHSHLGGKEAVISTTSGTKAILASLHCDRVFTGAFVNMDALVQYVFDCSCDHVSVLAAGYIPDGTELIEDSLCAQVFAKRLLREDVDEYEIRKGMDEAIARREHCPKDPKQYSRYADICFAKATGILDVVPEVQYVRDEIYVIEAREERRQSI